jgi:hypothetical protein
MHAADGAEAWDGKLRDYSGNNRLSGVIRPRLSPLGQVPHNLGLFALLGLVPLSAAGR